MSNETPTVEEMKEDPPNTDKTNGEDKKRPADEITPEEDEDESKDEAIPGEESLELDESASVAPNSQHVEADTDGRESAVAKTLDLPSQPIKRARTAYFIFADEMRQEIQKKHPGEGVGTIAREIGHLWSNLGESAKAEYQVKSALERERVSQELAKYKLENWDLVLPPAQDVNTLIFPLARLRKITKLDPDVKGVSKEALLLITKCAELVTSKLGQESVKVAQLQNRRKLLPEDVAQVCATREQFLFLREDVKDLLKEQHLGSKKALELKKGEAAGQTTASTSKTLTDFFSNSASK